MIFGGTNKYDGGGGGGSPWGTWYVGQKWNGFSSSSEIEILQSVHKNGSTIIAIYERHEVNGDGVDITFIHIQFHSWKQAKKVIKKKRANSAHLILNTASICRTCLKFSHRFAHDRDSSDF